jgi:hypothetical protein
VEIVDCAGKQRVGRRVAGDQHGLAQLCARLGERAAPFGLAVEHRFAVSGVRLGCGSPATAATGTPATSATAGEAPEVAQLFFSLPASDGFLLAGGGALLAQGLTARPTQDLDFFTRPGAGDVRRARDEFTSAAGDRGWTVERVRGRRFSKTELLELAREVDSGFDVRVFIDMLRHLARYGDVDLALGDVDVDIAALRAFFQQWMTELEAR